MALYQNIHIEIGADEKFSFQANFKFNNGSWTIYIINLVVLIHNIASVFKENKILIKLFLILIFNRTEGPGKYR